MEKETQTKIHTEKVKITSRQTTARSDDDGDDNNNNNKTNDKRASK